MEAKEGGECIELLYSKKDIRKQSTIGLLVWEL